MIKNTLTIAVRLIRRHKGFTIINLGGLAVGLAACLLISLFIQEEISFDRFHSKNDRIYRLGGSTVGWPYGKILEAEYPEVEAVVYMRSYPTYSIKIDDRRIFETMLYADPDFFKIFDFPLLEGDPENALSSPYSLVLSEELASRLLKDSPALGQTLILGDTLPCKISGIVRIPSRSHIQFDFLLSFETLRAVDQNTFDEEMAGGWLDLNVINYILLREGTEVEQFREKIRDLPRKHAGDYLDRWGANYQLNLEPMNRIYLHSKFGNWLGPKNDISYVYLLFFVGLFLLIIAGANFVNLATSRSIGRAKEIGVRKVIGSTRISLIGQLLGESFTTCIIAVILAGGLAIIMLPLFNELALKNYTTMDLFSAQTGLVAIGLVILMSFLAGAYPALSLSSFRPIEVLRGRFSSGKKGLRIRQGLVITQFLISSILIFGTLVVMSQLRYMLKQDLGFDSEQVLVLDVRRAPGEALSQRNKVFLDALAAHSSIKKVSSMGAVPGRNGWRGQISFPEGWPEGKSLSLEYIPVDFGFEKALGLKVIAGRAMDTSYPTDLKSAVMINEAAVEAAGWRSAEDSIGKRFSSPGSGKPEGIVVGVVQDYHHHGLKEKIEPMMFGHRFTNSYIPLRIESGQAAAAIRHVNQVWDRFFKGFPTSVFFLDEFFARQYAQEARLRKIASTFALLTILIACLGLFGLTAYTASQRIKEIGVRKVLGASVNDIIKLLSRDFLKLVFFAFLLAAPFGYFLMMKWLQNFAYRSSIGPELFIINGALLFLIAFGTMSIHSIKTARANPAKSIRHE